MRPPKTRPRFRSSRHRPAGNVINRLFDSSGPEGKVRGTPQQVIDKYSQMARDSLLSGDRVASENYQQHAEHYQRLLADAHREMEARKDAQERNGRDRFAGRAETQSSPSDGQDAATASLGHRSAAAAGGAEQTAAQPATPRPQQREYQFDKGR